MIIVSGHVRIRMDKREELIEAINALLAATREEPGCKAYRFSFDVATPELLCLHEEWATAEDLQTHLQQPHTAAFLGRLGEFTTEPPIVLRHTATQTEPLFP
jgi:quinol monooxygenase YgiN